MSVTCLISNTASDLRCPVCGQGFLLFAERTSQTVRHQLRRSVEKAMRLHHAGSQDHMHVHPNQPFHVESDDTMLGNGFSGMLQGVLAGAAC